MPAAEPIHLDVYGTSLCGLRSKLASALAAQASIEGRRVLLTERDSDQLRLALASDLLAGGGRLELFTVEGVPGDSYLVALAPRWDEATEQSFAELAASYDVVICSHGTVLGGNGASGARALLAGSFDGVIRDESVALAAQLKTAPFVAAVPEPEPTNYARNVAKAKEKHKELADGASWLMPLYGHTLFTLPQAAELKKPLWQRASELIGALELPAGASRAKPAATLLAGARPVNGNRGFEQKPSPPDEGRLAKELDDPAAADRALLKQLRAHTSGMRSKLEAQRQASASALEGQAGASAAACAERARQAREQLESQASAYATEDARLAEQYDSDRSRNANLAKQLRDHLEARAAQAVEDSRGRVAEIREELDAFVATEAERKEQIRSEARALQEQEEQAEQAASAAKEVVQPEPAPAQPQDAQPGKEKAAVEAKPAPPAAKEEPGGEAAPIATAAQPAKEPATQPEPEPTSKPAAAATAAIRRPEAATAQVASEARPTSEAKPAAVPAAAAAQPTKEQEARPQPASLPAVAAKGASPEVVARPQEVPAGERASPDASAATPDKEQAKAEDAPAPTESATARPAKEQETPPEAAAKPAIKEAKLKVAAPPAKEAPSRPGQRPEAPTEDSPAKLEPDAKAEAARIAREKAAAPGAGDEPKAKPEGAKPALKLAKDAAAKPAADPGKRPQGLAQKPAAQTPAGAPAKDDAKQEAKPAAPDKKKAAAPAGKLVGRTITRTTEIKFEHYIDHEGVAYVLEPEPLEKLYAAAIEGKNFQPPAYDETRKVAEQFKQLHDFYFKKLASKMRLAGGSYACALFALRLAARARAEEGLGTQERVLREFANDAFDNARHQEQEFPLAHWFLNLCWVTEHKLYSGDHKHVLKLVQNLVDILFSAKPGVTSKLHLQIMRALLAMLAAKLEEAAGEGRDGAKEANAKIIRRLFAELPPGLEEQLLYSKEKAAAAEDMDEEPDAEAVAKVKDAVLKASRSWGDMIGSK